MRPGDFSPGNSYQAFRTFAARMCGASMRPGDFSPGNFHHVLVDFCYAFRASMRPGDFSPGNTVSSRQTILVDCQGFNEAGGFLPRKLRESGPNQSNAALLQ